MRTKIGKTMVMVLAFIGFVSLLVIITKAEALEPRLLWEKTVPFKIDDIKMAGQSGDVILYSRDARQIILYEKNGNKRFHWGPRIDRQPMGIDISDDGNFVIYSTGLTEKYVMENKINLQKTGWDHRVHYVTRKGKEYWNKKVSGSPHLSPDGNLIAIGKAAGEGIGLTVLDSSGKILWEHADETWMGAGIVFSPDSNYVAVVSGGPDRFYLFEKNGNLLLTKDYNYGIYSIAEGANYISVYPNLPYHNGKVYDKNGNIVFEGFGSLSANGKRFSLLLDNKTVIYSLPDKAILKEYPIQGSEVILSSDGRFIVIVGKSIDTASTDNIFVIDMQENKIWTTYLGGSPWLFLTKDGKYLLIRNYEENKLLYYQLY